MERKRGGGERAASTRAREPAFLVHFTLPPHTGSWPTLPARPRVKAAPGRPIEAEAAAEPAVLASAAAAPTNGGPSKNKANKKNTAARPAAASDSKPPR